MEEINRNLLVFNEDHPFIKEFDHIQSLHFIFDFKKLVKISNEIDSKLESIYIEVKRTVLSISKDEERLYYEVYRPTLEEEIDRLLANITLEIRLLKMNFPLKKIGHRWQFESLIHKYRKRFLAIIPDFSTRNSLTNQVILEEINRRFLNSPDELIEQTFLKNYLDERYFSELDEELQAVIADIIFCFHHTGVHEHLLEEYKDSFPDPAKLSEFYAVLLGLKKKSVHSALIAQLNNSPKAPKGRKGFDILKKFNISH